MIEIFLQWYKNRHAYAREWKKNTGGQVMGFFCTQVPEEILYAADMLPVRIPDSHDPLNMTATHSSGRYCPSGREYLTREFPDRYDYLDGVMISPSCPPIPQVLTSSRLHLPVPFCCSLPPHQFQGPQAHPGPPAALAEWKHSVEEWTGKMITDPDLDRGIEILNESRRLRRQAFETRKRANPPLTGLEARYLSLTGGPFLREGEEHHDYRGRGRGSENRQNRPFKG
jgi:benzoyl-CoA reductase subunit C